MSDHPLGSLAGRAAPGAAQLIMRTLLAVCLLLASVVALAQQPTDLPSRQRLEAELDKLKQIETPDEQQKADLEQLRAALQALDGLEATRKDLDTLERNVRQAPKERRELQRQLSALSDDRPPDAAALDKLSVDALVERTTGALDQLETLQNQLATVNARLISAETLPERAQSAMAEAMDRAEKARGEVRTRSDDEDAAFDPTQARYRLALALAEQQTEYHRRELANNTQLRELDVLRRDLLARQVAGEEARLDALQAALDRARRAQSEQAVADVSEEDASTIAEHPVLSEIQATNRDLSDRLLTVTDRTNQLIRRAIDVRSQLDRVRQVRRTLNEQIEAIRGSPLLSRILNEQRHALPELDTLGGLQQEIAQTRLSQFDLVDQRDALRQPEALAKKSLEDAGITVTPSLVEALVKLFRSRSEILKQLDAEYGNLLTVAIDLQLNQEQLAGITTSLRGIIEEQLFWVASARPLTLSWWRDMPVDMARQVSRGEWQQALKSLWQVPDLRALAVIPVVLITGVLLLLRRRIKVRLLNLHEQIGRLKRDTQMHTPRAIFYNALLAAHGPLLLAAVGGLLRLGGDDFAERLGSTLLQLALAWGVLGWARRLLVADGVATRHFHWASGYVARLRRLLLWLGFSLIPVILISGISPGSQAELSSRPLSLLLLLAGLLAMSAILVRLILAHVPYFGLKLFRLLLGLGLALVPLILAGMIALGYEYAALRLIGRFINSLYLFGLWILVEATVVRGLAVAQRRLAYRRAVARRRAQIQEGAEGGLEVVEEPPLDMEQVNQQSLRLSKLILFIGFTFAFYLIWSDLLEVFSYLDHVRVWEIQHGQGEAMTVDPITFADVIIALITLALTMMMARNLPGLLEVMVLSRLSLKQGSAYAISSLLSYTIVGTGVVAALGTLGVSWDKLQWLVAALGVGLGFGLQEIFANFISGLIILFERPMRIGDTITLGQLHGSVSRIRIRATTVTDFDRKEIIIPNKTFVTDQLINWSLSDNVTRVVLTYGVAHGSDLDTVHQLLRQAAEANRRVLKDPEPQVFCISYGPTAFNFELRIFVNDLLDRLYASDEINRELDRLFREHGIRVAFNQMDVWLHGDNGQAAKVQTRRPDETVALGEPSRRQARSGDDGHLGDADVGGAGPDGGDGGGDGGR
ncbi:mechanosensitive channel MscK [Salinicola endophyticus]|uniref:Mechanosensitive channel MscK n=1 Tax=Salinicola endophyticus TaxID=1949083 RepID=A0ABY8FKE0_9GAMM|nr:mechanosensitive channel MscK [Salinicola endophyticus]WFF43277.1 mechanosensitive channel MscK [Salinicola endophyticus]